MLGARSAVRRPDPRRDGERPAIVRASASRPLPPLRPVADFVGLPDGGRTLSGDTAFVAAAAGALAALVLTTLLGVATSGGLAALVSWPYAVVLVLGAVGLPAARGAFRGLALALDHPSPVQHVRPTTPVTIVVTGAAPSEATTASLAAQDYGGPTTVVMPGAATIRPVTPLTLVVHAGVVLHPSALRLLVARLVSAPADTVVVTAHALVLATDAGVTAEACAAAWTHALDADQRTEHLFAGPLSADSACTLLRTDALTAVPGWALPGSRAALTWRLLERDARVAHEPLAVVFVPERVRVTTAARRGAERSRAVRAAAAGSPTSALPRASSRWLARLDWWAPTLDVIVAAAWGQALAFAALGRVTLLLAVLVLAVPLSLVPVAVERHRHADTLDEVGLTLVAPAVWVSYLAGLDALRAVLAVGAWREAPAERRAVTAPVTARPTVTPLPVAPAPVAAVAPAPRARRVPRVRRVRRLGGRARPYA